MMAHESLALFSDLYQLMKAQAYFNDRKMAALLLLFLSDHWHGSGAETVMVERLPTLT